ncbi:MAG: CoA-binding protein [Chromatiales bacterium]|nr:CoA-binding protein [Chromatiales bacterium]
MYPINPKHQTIAGQRCYAGIHEISEPVDLAVIATPAATVPEIVHACGEHGVRAGHHPLRRFGRRPRAQYRPRTRRP